MIRQEFTNNDFMHNNYGLYSNPMELHSNTYLPVNIKELLIWSEYIYSHSPILANAIDKYINYPLTEFTYTGSDKAKKATEELLIDVLDMKTHLLSIGKDYFVYGNAFRSVSPQSIKTITCTRQECITSKTPILASLIKDSEYSAFKPFACPTCGIPDAAYLTEMVTAAGVKGLQIINWNPHTIDISHNCVTNTNVYRLDTNTEHFKEFRGLPRVEQYQTPLNILEAIQSNGKFKFNSGMFHLKYPSISGMSSGWGITPLLHIIESFVHYSTLRKANEAIALEHIVPRTILYPVNTTNDPAMTSNLEKWRKEMTKNLAIWKGKDINKTVLAPYPTQSVNVGSQGKGLMMTGEMKELGLDMLHALNIHPDLIFNSTNLNNSAVALRMLESALEPFISQVRRFVNDIIKHVGDLTNLEFCEVDFHPFRLSDDVTKQQMMLNSPITPFISKSTLFAGLGLDKKDEDEKIKSEALEDAQQQEDIDNTIQHKAKTLADQSTEEARSVENTQVEPYDETSLEEKARGIASEIYNTPSNERQPLWERLKMNESLAIVALTQYFVAEFDKTQDADAISAAKGEV